MEKGEPYVMRVCSEVSLSFFGPRSLMALFVMCMWVILAIMVVDWKDEANEKKTGAPTLEYYRSCYSC